MGECIAVVIPSYKVRAKILAVLNRIGPEVSLIYVVDDACPERSGKFVEEHFTDSRIKVIYNQANLGVGGATLVGMKQASEDGADVITKLDGDGQMDPAFIPIFVGIIISGEADYTKGNRFFSLDVVKEMPISRLIGNAGLSFLAKLSTGYWKNFDPTNGYIAIHANLLKILPLEKISKRYFFESDLLFRLSTVRAKVIDIPMRAYYGDESSGLKPHRELFVFSIGHLRNFVKRIVYNYFVRDFSVASLQLITGLVLLSFGIAYGFNNIHGSQVASAGTVMVAALPIMVGLQFLLAFLGFDIQATPTEAIHTKLKKNGLVCSPLAHEKSEER